MAALKHLIASIILFLIYSCNFTIDAAATYKVDKQNQNGYSEFSRRKFDLLKLLYLPRAFAGILWNSIGYHKERTDSNEKVKSDQLKQYKENYVEHSYYGRMVRSVYDLLSTSDDNSNTGKSMFDDNTTSLFLKTVFDGYEVVDILKGSLKTPLIESSSFGNVIKKAGALVQGDNDKLIQEGEIFYGFVAYNKKTKDLAVIFRGTILEGEWLQDIDCLGTEWNNEFYIEPLQPTPQETFNISKLYLNINSKYKNRAVFQTGFLELYETGDSTTERYRILGIRSQIQRIINEKLKPNTEVKTITCSGHSLGASLAFISAYHIGKYQEYLKNKYPNKYNPIPIRLINFACPRCASPGVVNEFEKLGITHHHYYIRGDIVPVIMPGHLTNGKKPLQWKTYSDSIVINRFDPEKYNVVKDKMIKSIRSNVLIQMIKGSILFVFRKIPFLGFIPKLLLKKTLEKAAVLPDWHNLEHILYYMVVEYHNYQKDVLNVPPDDRVMPELGFLNADGDRIKSTRDLLNGNDRSYLQADKYKKLKANWAAPLKEYFEKKIVVQRDIDGTLAEKYLSSSIFKAEDEIRIYAEKYKSVYFPDSIYKNLINANK